MIKINRPVATISGFDFTYKQFLALKKAIKGTPVWFLHNRVDSIPKNLGIPYLMMKGFGKGSVFEECIFNSKVIKTKKKKNEKSH